MSFSERISLGEEREKGFQFNDKFELPIWPVIGQFRADGEMNFKIEPILTCVIGSTPMHAYKLYILTSDFELNIDKNLFEDA